ncbi:uncharacterized protein EDB93DRAFT_1263768 [Suillus bovinus]|uniref:uncharacterized protein n=1 Tax=Suillus bovinus TaxID=48563 RepID=UPI001B8812B7|nr:uncharacterized protein EDB93DRAFT_1263768 [Suillus bovinus]KAG2130323.1 hypothetical protein EDB93DRAFT_1263768 [Suillus bovinus]
MSPTTMFSPGPTLRGHHFTGALESELQGAQTMHSRFPEPLKAAFLKAMPRIKSHLDQCHLRLTELLTMTQFKFTRLVQILEEQHEKSHEKGMAALKDKVKWSGSFMDVQCSIMSCDHLAFSKSIIRRFIRDCVDRDAARSPLLPHNVLIPREGPILHEAPLHCDMHELPSHPREPSVPLREPLLHRDPSVHSCDPSVHSRDPSGAPA